MTGDTALLVENLMQALTIVLHIQMHCTQLLLLHLQHLLQQVMASSILMTKSNLQLVQFSKIQHKVQDRESMVDVKVPPKSIICASKIIAYIKCIQMVSSRCLFKNILSFLRHSRCLLNVTKLH